MANGQMIGGPAVRRLGLLMALAALIVGGAVVTVPVEAAAQSALQERQRQTLDSSRRSLDRATSATQNSLDRSQREIVDRTVRNQDMMRLRSTTRPFYTPSGPDAAGTLR